MSKHSEYATAQLAICQLPRVEDRLTALMWLLADTTADGARAVAVPLARLE